MRLNFANGILVAAVLLLALTAIWFQKRFAVKEIPQTELVALIESGEVTRANFDGGTRLEASLKPERAEAPPPLVYSVVVPGDPSVVEALQAAKVPYGATEAGGCASALPLVMLLAVVTAFMMFNTFRPQPDMPNAARISRSQAKLAPEEGTGVSFKDVAGIDEAEEELIELVQFLKTPERFTRLGGMIPKGVLLVGPPGTGKTLLARAVAGEAGVPFFSLSGSDFMELYVGVGAARVRDLFKQAAERAPCIVFIDEIDAIGKARMAGVPGGGEGERDQTLNQLLVEMDGFDGRKGIILMAATNRPDTLDAALLRPGRFDRQVLVDRPDVRGREAILRVHAAKLALAPEVDLKRIAQVTPGFVGADLGTALNEAALLAARRNLDQVGQIEIEDAVERISMGLERKSRRLSEEERLSTAVHESGHAIVAAGTPGASTVQKVTIIPRGIGALGYTSFRDPEERFTQSRVQMLAMMATLFGGRAAEELVYGEYNNGAANDIQQASDLARRMVTEFGMSDVIGPINYASERRNPFGMQARHVETVHSDETARLIDAEVRKLLEAAQDRARSLLSRNRDLLEKMAAALVKEESLSGERLAEFLSTVSRLELVAS